MYKSMIALVAAVTMLTACNSNETDENSKEVTEKSEQPVQTADEQGTQNESAQNETTPRADHEKWSSLPEYGKIIEQIGNEDYNFNKETDNDNKRVFLIDLKGEKLYKTIFVKNTNRLKIVKINGGGEIFNEVIK
ncbi:hypothetical protein AKG34_20575 [Peribacillus butanolivorans]|uniref:hypothetical protein n=1 Tax=Peribacillus butanolivorans TaxID=421767 RepID=UPI0006A71C1B|nr:hypothetical protein [Peribacillus butanolivorans]KON70931.1 hypothetical protein AKG34_20575 [Peribacillus butanolivorans]